MQIIKPRTLFAFMFYGMYLYLIYLGREVPTLLETIVTAQLSFYFGQKAKNGPATNTGGSNEKKST